MSVPVFEKLKKSLSAKSHSYVSKSPWLLHYDAASCNGCDVEVLAALTPLYDVERFGIINTGNPRHADIFLVTGSVNASAKPVIEQLYSQMVEPKVVVACGICACTGGIFKTCYNTMGGIDQIIPVDVYVPGCAVRPQDLIDGVVKALGILEQKAAALEAGLPVPTPPIRAGLPSPEILHTGNTQLPPTPEELERDKAARLAAAAAVAAGDAEPVDAEAAGADASGATEQGASAEEERAAKAAS